VINAMGETDSSLSLCTVSQIFRCFHRKVGQSFSPKLRKPHLIAGQFCPRRASGHVTQQFTVLLATVGKYRDRLGSRTEVVEYFYIQNFHICCCFLPALRRMCAGQLAAVIVSFTFLRLLNRAESSDICRIDSCVFYTC
jgi:hypothetical protein